MGRSYQKKRGRLQGPAALENEFRPQAFFGVSFAASAFTSQPPLPAQVFLPLQPLSLVLQPPLPAQPFLPAQPCAPQELLALSSLAAGWPALLLLAFWSAARPRVASEPE